MNIKKKSLLIFLAFYTAFAYGQVVEVEWHKSSFEYKNNLGRTKKGDVSVNLWRGAQGATKYISHKTNTLHSLDFRNTKKTIYVAFTKLKFGRNSKKIKLVVKKDCIKPKGVIKYHQSFHEFKQGETRLIIPFSVNDNGEGEIKISYDIVKENSNNLNDWNCDKGEITFKINASGFPINSEKNKKNLVDNTNSTRNRNANSVIKKKWDSLNKNNLTELCAFYARYSKTSYGSSARKKIRQLDELAWKKIKKEPSTIAYRQYLSDFEENCALRGRYVRQAKTNLKDSSILDEWESLMEAKDKEGIIAFMNGNEVYRQDAMNFIRDIFPIVPKVEELEKNKKYLLSLEDTIFAPRYKNISLNDGIVKIDDSNWLEAKKLIVELNKGGSYKIQVEDTIGRISYFDFGYNFKASHKNIAQDYQIQIEGGAPPYLVTLTDDANVEVWSEEFNESTILLNKEDLISNGIIGSFEVSLKHSADNLDGITFDQQLIIEKSSSVQIISSIIWGICMLVLFLLLLFFLRKRFKKPILSLISKPNEFSPS